MVGAGVEAQAGNAQPRLLTLGVPPTTTTRTANYGILESPQEDLKIDGVDARRLRPCYVCVFFEYDTRVQQRSKPNPASFHGGAMLLGQRNHGICSYACVCVYMCGGGSQWLHAPLFLQAPRVVVFAKEPCCGSVLGLRIFWPPCQSDSTIGGWIHLRATCSFSKLRWRRLPMCVASFLHAH